MNPFPAISIYDTGALPDMSISKFVSDSLELPIFPLALVGGGALLGGKKHRAMGALIGLGALYGLWSIGATAIASKR